MRIMELCRYIRNTGQDGLKIEDFDEDWEPAGRFYREELEVEGLIDVRDGRIFLTERGQAHT